jgi:hypothetical protein
LTLIVSSLFGPILRRCLWLLNSHFTMVKLHPSVDVT